MKNLRKLFGIISIIAAIACAMAACNPNEEDQTPSADDYVIGNLKQEAGSITAVTITPKTGKSPGARTIYYEGIGDTAYARSTTVPTGTSGSTYAIYNVTFDVAAATGWTEAKGLFAGLLTIGNPTPVAGDYEVSGLWQTFEKVKAVTITPRPGKSTGQRTIYYAGTGSTTYAKSTTLPSAIGTYAVTFDVAAATVWNAAAGLSAGTLEINEKPTPEAGDYDFYGLTQTAGSAAAITITPKAEKSSGARTVYYAGSGTTTYAKSTTVPTAVGSYAVTFDVAAAEGWNQAAGLSAGTLVLNTNPTPVAGDYEVSGLWQTAGEVSAVTIMPKTGKSSGGRTVYYEGTGGTTYPKSQTPPSAPGGSYLVTFDVAAVSGWNEAKGLSAGTLVVNNNQTPKAGDYNISGLAQPLGSVNHVTITPKTGKSSGQITRYYEGTGGTTYAKSATLPTAAGSYIVTFDVAAATGWNEAKALSAGTLTIANQALSVTISGTPGVGEELTADVQKNFAGMVTYQWLRNGEPIDYAEWPTYIPHPKDSGQKISVKVAYEGKESAPSLAVTIPSSFAYTVYIDDYYAPYLMADVVINGTWFTPTADEGFTVQWLRDGSPISGATSYWYTGWSEDLGKTITVRVSGYGQPVTSSNGIQITHNQLTLEPSDIDLRGTTWKANETREAYSLWGIDFPAYKIEYTLTFTTNSVWTIDMIAKQLVDGEWEDYMDQDNGGTYKTYKIDDNDVVFLDDNSGNPLLKGGVIYPDRIVFSDAAWDGSDLVFEKQYR
jgi:hypothetical protein